jgi:hypothetical protein
MALTPVFTSVSGETCMSLLNGPTEPIAFQPRPPTGPTYYLRQPMVEDRYRLTEVAGANPSGFWERIWALKAAIDRMAASGDYEAEFDQWHELIDAYSERLKAAAEADRLENSEESRAAFNQAFQTPPPLDEIIDHVKHADQVFERLCNRADAYREKSGLAAARLFLVGWQGPGLGRLRRDPGGVTSACLQLINQFDMVAIGDRVRELLEPPPAKVGNSDSPSLPQSSPTISGPTRTTAPAPVRRRGRPRKVAAHSNGQISAAQPITQAD